MDVIVHLTPFFLVYIGDDFLAFLHAAGALQGATEYLMPIE